MQEQFYLSCLALLVYAPLSRRALFEVYLVFPEVLISLVVSLKWVVHVVIVRQFFQVLLETLAYDSALLVSDED